jgi:heme-degrading monooxygenase HmoA
MSYVVINALTVPGGDGSVLEQRFAGRAGLVDQAEGFEAFQLLRPVEGTDQYLVYTRWRSAADFEAWQSSREFGKGHAQAAQDRNSERPASTAGAVWQFEVVQQAGDQ